MNIHDSMNIPILKWCSSLTHLSQSTFLWDIDKEWRLIRQNIASEQSPHYSRKNVILEPDKSEITKFIPVWYWPLKLNIFGHFQFLQ